METTISSQVHLAGPTVTVNGVRRQRCLWCGGLIDETDLASISRPLEPGEDPANPEPWEPASWEPGALVRVMGTSPRVSEAVTADEHPEQEGMFAIAPDSCMALDPEVTR